MKKFLFPMAAWALLTACTSAPEADEATTAEAGTVAEATGTAFAVEANNSSVAWAATKQTGAHNGSFALKSGEFTVQNGNITAGNFEVDVNSLAVLDLKGEEKGKLEGHLKSGDFFDVAKFPNAKFAITGVEAYDSAKATSKLAGATHIISGNLTLRDSTVMVSFPAKVALTDSTMTADADFNIDRTRWGMNYKGPNNPADWFIRKEVNLKLALKAAKK